MIRFVTVLAIGLVGCTELAEVDDPRDVVGAGNPRGHCIGTPIACGDDPNGGCGAGCYQASSASCNGPSLSCSDYDGNASACTAEPACTWYSSGGFCTGLSSCYASTQVECESNPRCYWGFDCFGVADPCEGQRQSACTSSPGCTWDVPDAGL